MRLTVLCAHPAELIDRINISVSKFFCLEIFSGCPTSPFDHARRPGEAGAEYNEQDEVAALDTTVADGFVQRADDRSGAGVAVLVEVDEEFLLGSTDALGDGVDDAG